MPSMSESRHVPRQIEPLLLLVSRVTYVSISLSTRYIYAIRLEVRNEHMSPTGDLTLPLKQRKHIFIDIIFIG